MFSVVEFAATEKEPATLAAVPNIWLSKDKKKVHWPPRNLATKFAKNKVSPAPTWDYLAVKILNKVDLQSWDEAQKCVRKELKGSESETPDGKRRRQPTKKYDQNQDDVDDQNLDDFDSDEELPMTPSPKKSKLKPFDSDQIQSSDAALLVQPLRKSKPSKPPASNQEDLDEGSDSAEDTPLAEDAEPAMSESSGQKKILLMLHKIDKRIEGLEKKILKERISFKDFGEDLAKMTSLEELKKFNEQLGEPEFKAKWVATLMKEKGDNPPETTRLVMRRIAIQEVWAGMSYKGQRGKASISTVPMVARILKG